jgi:uncharacterized protein (DUF2384 family)
VTDEQERIAALARAIARATDRYDGEASAVLDALAGDGWTLTRRPS